MAACLLSHGVHTHQQVMPIGGMAGSPRGRCGGVPTIPVVKLLLDEGADPAIAGYHTALVEASQL